MFLSAKPLGKTKNIISKKKKKKKKIQQQQQCKLQKILDTSKKEKKNAEGIALKITVLSLRPHLVAPFLSCREGRCVNPLTRLGSLFLGLCWFQADTE